MYENARFKHTLLQYKQRAYGSSKEPEEHKLLQGKQGSLIENWYWNSDFFLFPFKRNFFKEKKKSKQEKIKLTTQEISPAGLHSFLVQKSSKVWKYNQLQLRMSLKHKEWLLS